MSERTQRAAGQARISEREAYQAWRQAKATLRRWETRLQRERGTEHVDAIREAGGA